MKPNLFVKNYLPYALRVEREGGPHHVAILTQAALESAWGDVAPGNMFFGVKDTDGVNGNEQLLVTTEYTKTIKNPMPVPISTTPVVRNGQKYFKHRGKDYFRKYDTPYECFKDHAAFFVKNKRYAEALKHKTDYLVFFREIAKAGYATDPNYADTLIAVSKTIVKNLPK